MRSHTEVIVPLSASELERAIVGPAEQVGLTFETGLVATILKDVGEQPGTLPLLEYALSELYERRQDRLLTLAAYRELGGISGALARRADELFESLDEAGQNAARQMFLRLITLGEGVEDTRRRVLQAELASLMADDQDDGRCDRGLQPVSAADVRPRPADPRADRGNRPRGADPRMGAAARVAARRAAKRCASSGG